MSDTHTRWRLLIPLLPKDIPLFVPDLPGYGNSAPPKSHSKLDVGTLILEALREQFHSTDSLVPLILVGHDRGARVIHRLQVSHAAKEPRLERLNFSIKGIGLLDIVPTKTQWLSFSTSPQAAAGVFHWPFLANAELAKDMIAAFGGGKWCNEMILKWAGSSESGLEKLKSGDSLQVYASFFDKESVIEASCQDYKAGATVDVFAQEDDQSSDRKVNVPLLLAFSVDYFGTRADPSKVWLDWVADPSLVTTSGITGGVGHFVAEEAPEKLSQILLDWTKALVQ
jgi:pimeloyl-ACP methyl ester carboxylesterase